MGVTQMRAGVSALALTAMAAGAGMALS